MSTLNDLGQSISNLFSGIGQAIPQFPSNIQSGFNNFVQSRNWTPQWQNVPQAVPIIQNDLKQSFPNFMEGARQATLPWDQTLTGAVGYLITPFTNNGQGGALQRFVQPAQAHEMTPGMNMQNQQVAPPPHNPQSVIKAIQQNIQSRNWGVNLDEGARRRGEVGNVIKNFLTNLNPNVSSMPLPDRSLDTQKLQNSLPKPAGYLSEEEARKQSADIQALVTQYHSSPEYLNAVAQMQARVAHAKLLQDEYRQSVRDSQK